METNKKSPGYVTTKIGKINYLSIIYAYAKIINFYNTYKRLPNSIKIIAVTPFNNFTNNNGVIIGRTDYGMVVRESPYGNPGSPNKVVFVVGVHPLEAQSHDAIIEAIRTLNNSLKKCYYIYRINVTKDASDYNKGRQNGELLANTYAVPSIKKTCHQIS
ncbi:MAG TPA: hypothetical protein HA298_04385 [Methanobacteriales archaeon]|nr:hypothetical protein [Methanobacteriaceae archaeon]MBC7096376.1 hypothetical protein [Methanobacteriales archaeon]MDI3484697.1 hypothetical protein [Methanobacteriaceae archaeon]HIH61906.1 hypothetical protein [Methanobacteriales archaeon]